MHEKGASGKKDSIVVDPSGKVKEGKMTNVNPTANGPTTIGTKSASFRQCKSFNLKETMLPKPPNSHENSKTAKSHGASSRLEASATVENGSRTLKPNGASKSSDLAVVAKSKQTDNGKLDPKAEILSISRSDRVKSPSNGGILKSSSSKVNVEALKNNIKETSPKPSIEHDKGASKVKKVKDTSPKSALANVKSFSLSLNADPQKKLPPIKTGRVGGGGKSVSAKNTANLCAECKAELEGAVCFIGNDGRVSACTSRTAVRLCKNLKCANNNPEYVASVAAAIAAPKKYLVSRRHSLNLPRSSNKSSKGTSDKVHAESVNQNSTTPHSSDLGAIPKNDGEHDCEELDMQGELEDDVTSLGDMGEVIEIDGIASASPHRGRANGFQRMRRKSFSVIEKEGPEVVTLKKQMMQERKQAEEWMLDYAIEEALHRLAPSKDSKVKALVEAFESIIIPQKDAEAAQDQPEGPKTPNKICV